MICIWHPFECDMSFDGTLTSRIERYGLSDCHLDPYSTRMDAICIFSHEIPLNLHLLKVIFHMVCLLCTPCSLDSPGWSIVPQVVYFHLVRQVMYSHYVPRVMYSHYLHPLKVMFHTVCSLCIPGGLDRPGWSMLHRWSITIMYPGWCIPIILPLVYSHYFTPGGVFPLSTPGGVFPLCTPGDVFPLCTPGGVFPLSTPGGVFPLSTPGDVFPLSTPGDVFPLFYPGWCIPIM